MAVFSTNLIIYKHTDFEQTFVLEDGLSNSAKDYLIEEGYDRKFGARPLERLIQKKIKEPLADEIIFGKLKKGGKVIVEFNKEQLKIKLTK